jgi:hypothetical protein
VSARDPFWEQVHAALDARRDPLEDPRVQQLLAERPERLTDLAAVRSGLARVARAGRRRARRRVATAAAAVALLAVGFAAALRATHPSSSASEAGSPEVVADVGMEPVTVPPIACTPLQVLAFRAEVTVEGPRGRRTSAFDGRQATVRSEARSGRPGALVLVATASVALP